MSSGCGHVSRSQMEWVAATYDGAVIVFVRIGFHIPDDLMRKELRELRSLQDVALDVAESIVAKSLHDLGHVEEGNVHRVVFQRPHGILEQEWVVPVRR